MCCHDRCLGKLCPSWCGTYRCLLCSRTNLASSTAQCATCAVCRYSTSVITSRSHDTSTHAHTTSGNMTCMHLKYYIYILNWVTLKQKHLHFCVTTHETMLKSLLPAILNFHVTFIVLSPLLSEFYLSAASDVSA